MTRQVLGHVPRVQLRPAVDVRAVALDDNRESHDSDGSASGSGLRTGHERLALASGLGLGAADSAQASGLEAAH